MRTLLAALAVLGLLAAGPIAATGGGSSVGASTVGHAVGTGPADSTQASQQLACDYASLYDDTIGSVVTVQVFGPRGSGLGSGFVYDDRGHVVTNQHVVGNATRIEVQFDRGEWRTAEVVGTDVYSDLAVLAVNSTPDYAEPLDVSGQLPTTGQRVAALGSPLGLQGTITSGIVSGTNRSLPAGGQSGPQFPIPNTLQTTAAINPGNSGGPLVSCEGGVVGVNTATASGTENTGFAVPATRVQRVVPELIRNGSYENSFLGVTTADLSPIVAQANDLNVTQGVLVVGVLADSPAAGVLQPSDDTQTVDGFEVPAGGDVILRVDGTRIASQEDLASVLVRKRPGETVTMTVLRDGERQQIEVELGERPPPETATDASST